MSKSYTKESNAKKAVEKDGLQNFPHRIARRIVAGGTYRYAPIFKPELPEDREELIRRGWEVE